MKSLHVAAFAIAVAVFGQSSNAHAWLKFKNSTPNPVWVGNAYAAFHCSVLIPIAVFQYGTHDSCGSDTMTLFAPKRDFRVRGWYNIAPGGTKTVDNLDWSNSVHQFYADDAFGNVWDGNDHTFCTSAEPVNHCGDACPANTVWELEFRDITDSVCCGPCSGEPEDHTVNLVP